MAADRGRLGGRVANYLSFLALASARVAVGRRPDAVVAGSDPRCAVFAGLIAARGPARDLQPAGPPPGGGAGRWPDCPRPLARTWDRLHTWAMQRCAAVVCLGPAMARTLVDKGVAESRIHVVPNGSWASPGEPDPQLVHRIRGDASFVVVHAGNAGTSGLGTR